MKKALLLILLPLLAVLIVACKSDSAPSGKPVKSAPVGNMTATIASDSGALKHDGQEFYLTFTDASGKPVDVGAASLNFHMPGMGPMAVMNDPATLTTTSTPGVYRANANIEMAGEWQAQVTYEGPRGKGQTSFPVTVQ